MMTRLYWLTMMFVFLAGACGDTAPEPDAASADAAVADAVAPDLAVVDRGPDSKKPIPDAGQDTKTPPPDGGATVAQLVSGAVQSGCEKKWLQAIANSGAKPGVVRQALVALDKQVKLKKWTTGYSYGHPLKINFKVPELKNYSYDYTLYVPASYKADPSKPIALWVDPAHPTTPLKDTYTLKAISTRGNGKFIVLGINFMNILYSKMDPATYDSMGKKGIVFYQDNFSLFDEAIAQVKRAFHIDSSKVYISGVSAKGAASWFHGIFAADQYAAIHPVSIIPVDWDKEMYLNLMNTGVYVWQGDADTITPLAKVQPMIDKIKGYGLKVFMYVQKGGSHGGTLYYNAMPSIMSILLKNYTRTLLPERVHKGIMTPRAAGAYWLEASTFSAPLPSGLLKTAVPPVVLDATWKGKQVTLNQVKGVSQLKIKWMAATATGAGQGKAGDQLTVSVNGKTKGPYPLQEHPTLAVETYCRWRDISRLWAGQVVVKLP